MTTPQNAEPTDAITGTGVRNWWPVITGTACALLFMGAVYTRFENLELRVSNIEHQKGDSDEQFKALTAKISKMDRKLSLFICSADRTKCDVLGAINNEP